MKDPFNQFESPARCTRCLTDLRQRAALTQTANQAATLGMAMLAASRNAPPVEEPAPKTARDLDKWSTEDLEVLTALLEKYEGGPVESTEQGSTLPPAGAVENPIQEPSP